MLGRRAEELMRPPAIGIALLESYHDKQPP
jgi:hypothetical protein